MLSDLEAILTLIRTEGIGPKTYLDLFLKYGSPQEAIQQNPKKMSFKPLKDIHQEIESVQKFGAELITLHSPLYPQLLKETVNPPIVLTIKGNSQLLHKPSLGIVGARNASSNGKILATRLSKELGEKGYVISSGLARGIDAAAHKGSIETGTIAVIGCGINVFYPDENQALQREIFEKGLVISEFAFNEPPQSAHFPQRNRIISGLSRGIIVVEAALKSGSLITAHTALDQGREVLSVPGSPLDPRCQGTNKLLKEGATLVENSEDVLNVFGEILPQKERPSKKNTHNPQILLESPKESMLENLSYSPISIDHIMLECSIPPNEVHAILLELELEEKIERHPGNKVSLKINE